MSYSIGIAGSTEHTLLCARALKSDARFDIVWVLTPSPRLVGRKQELVKNPMHVWAEEQHIPVIFVEKKIDEKVKTNVEDVKIKPDFLIVVDFGYIVPNWLLELPTIAPINIHPSDLPKFRGSSPGQFALLYGEEKSAVSVIIMNNLLDQGELIYQYHFDVLSTWTMSEYYNFAFENTSEQLPKVLADFASGEIKATPQPLDTPTPIARRLSRDDGFVSWELLQGDIRGTASQLLLEVNQAIQNWPQTINNAIRALSPWPGVWTTVKTEKGEKRMKILSASLQGKKLNIERVQIEGELPMDFSRAQQQLL